LAPAVQAELEAASQQGRLVLSIISVWEVALLHSKGRILLSMPLALWLERALASSGLTLLPLAQPTVMVDACTLPGEFHADPADRILVATARAENPRLCPGGACPGAGDLTFQAATSAISTRAPAAAAMLTSASSENRLNRPRSKSFMRGCVTPQCRAAST
jgi:PIN domain nuclease of toxin-antitoxin system